MKLHVFLSFLYLLQENKSTTVQSILITTTFWKLHVRTLQNNEFNDIYMNILLFLVSCFAKQAFLVQDQDTLKRTLQLTIKRYCPETLNNMKLYRTQKMIELKGIDREAFIANAIKIIHFSFFLKASRTIS